MDPEEYLGKLNTQQRAAVEYCDGPQLVINASTSASGPAHNAPSTPNVRGSNKVAGSR